MGTKKWRWVYLQVCPELGRGKHVSISPFLVGWSYKIIEQLTKARAVRMESSDVK